MKTFKFFNTELDTELKLLKALIKNSIFISRITLKQLSILTTEWPQKLSSHKNELL